MSKSKRDTKPDENDAISRKELHSTLTPGGAEAAFPPMVTTEICLACNKQDLGLIYCDTCEDLGGLYHAECLTLLDTAKRACAECIRRTRNTKPAEGEVNGSESERSGSGGLAQRNSDSKANEATTDRANLKKSSDDSDTSLSEESSSTTTSSSESSSNTLIKQYTPRQRGKLGNTTLPSLEKATPPYAKQTSKIIDTSPLQTRGQRKKNTREDAFDTSEEEDSDK